MVILLTINTLEKKSFSVVKILPFSKDVEEQVSDVIICLVIMTIKPFLSK